MTPMVWPNGSTSAPVVSSGYGPRKVTIPGASAFHRGVDTVLYATVCAVADGVVVHVGRMTGWAGGGYMIWIQHAGFLSRSLHLVNGSARVYVGQRVYMRQPIATMGNTGINGGVHHHLEIVVGGAQVDPVAFIRARLAGPASVGAAASAGIPGPAPKPLEDNSMALVIQRKSDGFIALVDVGMFAHMPDMATANINRQVMSITDEMHSLDDADFDRVTRSLGIPDGVRQRDTFWSKDTDLAAQLRDVTNRLTAQSDAGVAALAIDDGQGGTHLAILGPKFFRHLTADENPDRIRNLLTASDTWSPTTVDELPALLRSFAVDDDIFRIVTEGGRTMHVLDPLDGGFKPGGVWSAENVIRAKLAS